jgi:phosphoglycolate phosphatase
VSLSPPVVFDLDGTLIDSAPDIRLAVNLLMAEMGLPDFPLPEIVSFIGDGLPVLTRRVMAARSLPEAEFQAVYPRLARHYDAANGQLTRPYPGVAESLASLAAAGSRLALCTNKPMGPTLDILRHCGLGEMFSHVVGGDSLPSRKPDPEGLHACFAHLGGPGVYVGDSEVDAETARRAGAPFFLFSGGYRKTPVASIAHRRVFDGFGELPGLVAAFAAGD